MTKINIKIRRKWKFRSKQTRNPYKFVGYIKSTITIHRNPKREWRRQSYHGKITSIIVLLLLSPHAQPQGFYVSKFASLSDFLIMYVIPSFYKQTFLIKILRIRRVASTRLLKTHKSLRPFLTTNPRFFIFYFPLSFFKKRKKRKCVSFFFFFFFFYIYIYIGTKIKENPNLSILLFLFSIIFWQQLLSCFFKALTIKQMSTKLLRIW